MLAPFSIKGKPVETKNFPFQLKSINEDEGTVTGHLSTFGNVDLQKDRVMKGAFKKTLSDAYSRKKNGRKFLIPDLWMHDPEQPTGGVIEAEEDADGLLVTMQYDITTNAAGIPNNPIATMVFSGHKMGYIDELSMGYLAIQKEFDGGIRNLKEVQLIECSAVTMLFAANPEALTTGVKGMFETKTVCGNTSGEIGPRDESWDGAKAKNQIWQAAENEDGSISSSIAKKYFMVCDGDGSKKGDYGYPFWYVGDSPHICVGAVKAIAAAIQGARGANAPDGLKSKVETLYRRINAKYPDDPELTPPWEDGKRSTMNGQQKNFHDLFQSARAADCLESLGNLLNTFTQAAIEAFRTSEQPEQDMQQCVEQFGIAATKWTGDALSCNLSQYMTHRDFMARVGDLPRKAGRTISAATQANIEGHQKSMKDLLDQHASASDQLAAQVKSMCKGHIDAMQEKVSDLTRLWAEEGQGPAYSDDKDKSRITRREPQPALTRRTQPPQSTENAIEELAALLS